MLPQCHTHIKEERYAEITKDIIQLHPIITDAARNDRDIAEAIALAPAQLADNARCCRHLVMRIGRRQHPYALRPTDAHRAEAARRKGLLHRRQLTVALMAEVFQQTHHLDICTKLLCQMPQLIPQPFLSVKYPLHALIRQAQTHIDRPCLRQYRRQHIHLRGIQVQKAVQPQLGALQQTRIGGGSGQLMHHHALITKTTVDHLQIGLIYQRQILQTPGQQLIRHLLRRPAQVIRQHIILLELHQCLGQAIHQADTPGRTAQHRKLTRHALQTRQQQHRPPLIIQTGQHGKGVLCAQQPIQAGKAHRLCPQAGRYPRQLRQRTLALECRLFRHQQKQRRTQRFLPQPLRYLLQAKRGLAGTGAALDQSQFHPITPIRKTLSQNFHTQTTSYINYFIHKL